MNLKLLDGCWDVEVFLDRSAPGHDDNVFVRIREECDERLRILRVNQATIGLTAAQARELARGLLEVAAGDEAAATEEAWRSEERRRPARSRVEASRDRPRFTKTQGRYLAFIQAYMKLHGRAPAEAEFQHYFRVSPPSAHQMIVTLERKGLISRVPGAARSIRLAVPADQIPPLDVPPPSTPPPPWFS
ncbi:MAG: hypothetical protein HYY24_02555 [Verrucomicrobia bacterium]|nr:hypothetical protein [Verrucomicrobiota bacterium]